MNVQHAAFATGTHYVSLDVGGALDAPVSCPSCHDETLGPVGDGQAMVFGCRRCGRLWRAELDMLVEVDPSSTHAHAARHD
ncbi:hypothetical protein JCM18899A_41250 [Nocardioides sp. AN3]